MIFAEYHLYMFIKTSNIYCYLLVIVSIISLSMALQACSGRTTATWTNSLGEINDNVSYFRLCLMKYISYSFLDVFNKYVLLFATIYGETTIRPRGEKAIFLFLLKIYKIRLGDASIRFWTGSYSAEVVIHYWTIFVSWCAKSRHHLKIYKCHRKTYTCSWFLTNATEDV